MNSPTSTETLLGGAPFQATKRDGTSESVTIKQLSIRELTGLAAVLEDENAQADLYCGKEKGWSDTLTNDCVEQIVLEGERINADFFSRWVKRRMDRLNRIIPGSAESLVSKLAETSLRQSQT